SAPRAALTDSGEPLPYAPSPSDTAGAWISMTSQPVPTAVRIADTLDGGIRQAARGEAKSMTSRRGEALTPPSTPCGRDRDAAASRPPDRTAVWTRGARTR